MQSRLEYKETKDDIKILLDGEIVYYFCKITDDYARVKADQQYYYLKEYINSK